MTINNGYPKRQFRGGVSPLHIAVLFALLLLPLMSVLRLAGMIPYPSWLFGYVAAISAATYFFYRHDKKRAQAGEWRIPESTLHFLEFIGGWPGAFLAQRTFRHKTSKTSFQIQYWAIVALHEYASVDFLHGWAYSIKVIQLLFQ